MELFPTSICPEEKIIFIKCNIFSFDPINFFIISTMLVQEFEGRLTVLIAGIKLFAADMHAGYINFVGGANLDVKTKG